MDHAEDVDMRRVVARYFGHVQGVGFRYTVKMLAGRFDVSGSVNNEPDGSVKLIAEGRNKEVAELLEAVESSQLGRHIRDRRYEWGPPQGDTGGFYVG